MSWVWFLKFKSETFENFKKFKVFVEKQSGCQIKTLRTDRGGEFTSKEFSTFSEEYGIRRELTASYTPEQNGIAGRKKWTVVEMGKTMMKARAVPKKFWVDADSNSSISSESFAHKSSLQSYSIRNLEG